MIKDWELVCVVSGALATVAFFATFSWAMFGQVLAPSLFIGFIILIIRRAIIKTTKSIKNMRKDHAQKKQAV